MDEVCAQCGKTISRRAKATIWKGEHVVCTACLHELEGDERRDAAAESLAGRAGAPWLVHDGRKQWGPYPTDQVIALLAADRIQWEWKVWREGMAKWKQAMGVFTIPELSNGRVELREFGQGDGTYRFRPA